jgi:hypothetical protein
MYGCTTQPGCWDEDIPESISQASIDLFLAALSGQRGSEKRRLCLGYQFNVLSGPLAPKLNALDNILALSEANNLPVVLTIDPFEFWDGMPQLWNFWNSSHPGYDPNNVMNVEWTGPSPANATSVSWANWGAQFRKAPCPNLSSVAFRAAAAEAMRPFLSRIADFDASLALQGKLWLLAGVKCSWEASIGVNYFEYPNPNSFTNPFTNRFRTSSFRSPFRKRPLWESFQGVRSGVPLQRKNVTMLQSYNVTKLQCYNCYNVTAFQECR